MEISLDALKPCWMPDPTVNQLPPSTVWERLWREGQSSEGIPRVEAHPEGFLEKVALELGLEEDLSLYKERVGCRGAA